MSQDGQQLIALRDPMQISETTLLVTPAFYSLLPLLNGKNSILEIQVILTRQAGRLVFREDVERLVEQLDAALFLENDRFREKQEQLCQHYQNSRIRIASHAGISYPQNPDEIRQMVDSFFLAESGAGRPESVHLPRIRALAAPHIDLRLGGPVYSFAYRTLAESHPSDLFLVLGIGHMGFQEPYSVSNKDFETPLGRVPSDQVFIDVFRRKVNGRFPDHHTHRMEHSIEFQLILLQHILKERTFRIIPVLTHFSYQDLVGPEAHRTKEHLDLFTRAVLETEKETNRRATIIASVDLAHVGPRYGDPQRPDNSEIEDVIRKDKEIIQILQDSDQEAFLSYIVQERDKRKTCGFPALYTLLGILNGEKGRLLSHDYSEMDPTRSFVTYASMVWHEIGEP